MHFYFGYYGVPGLLVLVLDILAIMSVLSSRLPFSSKLLWILLILILPVIGLILWMLLGSRSTA